MDYQNLIFEKKGGVAIMTLNRPQKLNALNFATFEEMTSVCAEVEKDDNLKVLIMTGTGRAFSSGGDVSDMESLRQTSTLQGKTARMLRWTLALYNMQKPTIAAINGVAAGGGWSMAMLCDMRIASDKSWYTMSFVNRALVPDMGVTYVLPRLLGMPKAIEIMLTADRYDAAEALRLGVVNRVVPHDDLMKVTMELATKIANGPAIAVHLIKEGVRSGIANTMEKAIEWEAVGQHICQKTEDHKEGARSFLEKRSPVFKGK